MGLNQWLERMYAAGSTRPPKRMIRAVGALHRFAIVKTGGRFGSDLLDRPILLLTTTGRRSGKQRTQPLMYVREADCYLVAASFGGHDQDPAWLTNLRANPQASIVIVGRELPVVATVATPNEREGLWPRFSALFSAYEKYQRSTDRKIPVVRLCPRGVYGRTPLRINRRQAPTDSKKEEHSWPAIRDGRRHHNLPDHFCAPGGC